MIVLSAFSSWTFSFFPIYIQNSQCVLNDPTRILSMYYRYQDAHATKFKQDLSFLSMIFSLHPPIHLSRIVLGELSRPLHLGRSNSTTVARRAIGDRLECRSHSGTGADGELFAVGAADH